MTREEIENQAKSYTLAVFDELDDFSDVTQAYIDGAEWMQETRIEKAIQWIESYLFDIGFPDDWCRDSATMKSGKQRFLEAMEE